MNYYNMDGTKVLKELGSSLKGLTSSKVKENRIKYGANILPKGKKKTLFGTFINQFNSPIIYILIVTIILSFIIGEITDGVFIIIVILIDTILGTIQEWKAEKNSEALEKLVRVEAKVVRDDVRLLIDSSELVVGDIVVLESGDKISADLRMIQTNNLTIDESLLTGESNGVIKISTIVDKHDDISKQNMCYGGTIVLSGRGLGVVVGTGSNTEVGKIADVVLLRKPALSPLIMRMKKFTKQIGILVFAVAIILSYILYLKGYVVKDIFLLVVALSVSAIPEGLPVALTMVLSIGSGRMAKKNVIVKKLNSVESLGSCTIIATDKTGTLTVNEQTLKKLMLPDGSIYEVSGSGYNDDGKIKCSKDSEHLVKELAFMGVINNEASLIKENKLWSSNGDSIDIAFLSFGYKTDVINDKNKVDILGRIPYESEKQYSVTYFSYKDENICTMKGSCEKVLEYAKWMQIDDELVKIDKDNIMHQNDILAKDGYRVIALAKGNITNFRKKDNYDNTDIPSLTFIGLVGFIDPVRSTAKKAVNECIEAGIKVVMITGDHPITAYAIANELDIVKSMDEVTDGVELSEYLEKGEKEFDSFIINKKVFARVDPMQKLAIVESYKRNGEFIAVTGDGVNDAPALRNANIGIAMGSGTEVAKEVATMIITDNDFSSIVSGVNEGRVAYSNVRKVIYMLLSTGISEVLFFIISVLLNLPAPLIAIQLLWLNLVTDGIQDMALATEKGEEGIMREKPRNPKERIFDKVLVSETVISGIVISVIVIIFWQYLIRYLGIEITLARSYVLLLMVFMQNIHVFSCRSEKVSAFKMPFKNNPFVVLAVLFTMAIQIVFLRVEPLANLLSVAVIDGNHIFKIFLLALPILLVMELYKLSKKSE